MFANITVACGSTTYHPDKSEHNDKSKSDFVKMKLRRDPTSEKSDVYESIIALFYNGDRGYFLFGHNFKRNLKASGTLHYDAKNPIPL